MKKRKKVALFINSLCGGGAERVISRISKELSREYKLYIFLIDTSSMFYECMGKIVDLCCGSSNYLLNAMHAVCSINKVIKMYDIDCVISFLDVPNIINCIITKEVKKIASIRDYTSMELCRTQREKAKLFCLIKVLKKADKVISVSQELNIQMIQEFQIDKNKAGVIENSYDVREIENLAKKKIDVKSCDFIQKYKTAVAVGRLDAQKGYEDLIDIFAEVSKKDSRAALIILGEGALKKSLKRMIREKHLEKRVLLLGLRENPFAYMGKCQLFVSSSLHEGFPNALVEAMACGIPVIHTDCRTGPREIIVGSVECSIVGAVYASYGILIPSYTRKQVSKEITQKEFVNAWLKLLDSDELREKYSNASRMRARNYSMDRCIKKYKAVIER